MTATARIGMKRRRKTDLDSTLFAHGLYAPHLNIHPWASTATTITFFENFLSLFTTDGESKGIGNRLTWLQHIPQAASSRSDRVLVLALQATATAYGGIMTSNTALTWQAQKLYGTALRAHQAVLRNRGSNGDVTIHMVSTCVLLSFFEAMRSTTADAYCAHIYGAVKLLEITGPGECAHGVLCQLFYHVRTQMLFVQVGSNSYDVPLAAKRILHDTLMYRDPPMIQKLMCCITALHDLRTSNAETCGSRAQILTSLELQVEELWLEYSSQTSTCCAAKTGSFDDGFTALTIAYFSSARILLGLLSLDWKDVSDLSRHCQVILDAALFLDTSRHAIAYMRMATPLVLVALHSQWKEHHMGAVGIFEGWAKGTMRGISELALGAVRQHKGAT
ncbi:hypothetical protein E8E11_007190 [Didymella keratinophila]|nr:hypothetical protein E8E11_007190 [Didymella keratinophila]